VDVAVAVARPGFLSEYHKAREKCLVFTIQIIVLKYKSPIMKSCMCGWVKVQLVLSQKLESCLCHFSVVEILL